MKRFSSVLYGTTPEPENFSELVDLITFKNNDSQIVHMWRGQSNIEWRLDHSAYRRLRLDKKNLTEQDLISYEEELLRQATHRGYRRQDGRSLSDFELLAKLQHHGAATRLLDFTRNALIAVWYCVNSDKNKMGMLVGLSTDHVGGYETQELQGGYKSIIKDLKEYPHPQTWEPPVVTLRIAAQHSQFIYSSLSDDERSSITLSKYDDANLFIAISPKLKVQAGEILEKSFDFTYHSLFPDIDGFGKSNSHVVSRWKNFRW